MQNTIAKQKLVQHLNPYASLKMLQTKLNHTCFDVLKSVIWIVLILYWSPFLLKALKAQVKEPTSSYHFFFLSIYDVSNTLAQVWALYRNIH